jgi:hypothetical protein
VSFEQTLAHFCAPVLCGIKPASLISLDGYFFARNEEQMVDLNKKLGMSGMCIVPVYRQGQRVLLFVFNCSLLKKSVRASSVVSYLAEKKYPVGKGFFAILKELLFRLERQEPFPHEAGLFLGYPLEDVCAFERCLGRGYKYHGYWKVYGDVPSARRQCKRYDMCRDQCKKWIKEGVPLALVNEKYASALGESA